VKKLLLALSVLFLANCSPEEIVTLSQSLQTCESRQGLIEVVAGEDCVSIAKGTKLMIVSEAIVGELTYECVRREGDQECRWALGPVRRFGKT
jgi:hypothetical protein